MDLSKLRALLALQDLASLARAGEQLHLSPSAIFCQIRQLEEETGQKLYERIGRRLSLTNAGATLAQHARKILFAHEAATAAMKELSGAPHETLRFGCGPHGSVRIAPFLLHALVRQYPGTDVRLTSSDDQSLLRDVRSGALDAILMSLPVGDRELTEEPLWSYEMVFVLPPHLRSDRRAPRLADLQQMPFILYRRAVVIDSALPKLCAALGFEPRVIMENDELDSIKELVKLGFGVTLLPLWSVGGEARKKQLRILRPPERHFQNYGLLYRKSEHRPRVVAHVREVAQRWKEWWPHAAYVSPAMPNAGR